MIVDHHLRELLDFICGAAIDRQLSEIDLGHVDNREVVNEILGILTGDVGGTVRRHSGRFAAFGLAGILAFVARAPGGQCARPGRTTEPGSSSLFPPPPELSPALLEVCK